MGITLITHDQLHIFDSLTSLAHLITSIGVIFFLTDEPLPIPVCPPYSAHLLNWNALCLRQEVVNENGHHEHKERKEEEEPKFQMAEHRQEDLSHDESEDHVH